MSSINHVFATLIMATLLLSAIPPVQGNSPDDLDLVYDFEEQKLYVTITHSVGNPNSHYIELVEVRRNGELNITQAYTSQPDDEKFTYIYNITAEDGDELEVYAKCSQFGDRTESITIDAPKKKMSADIDPMIESIEEGGSQTFNVTITSNGTGLDEVDLAILQDHGNISGLHELGSGVYQFTYDAGNDTGGDEDTLNITASKDGYEDAFVEITFTITVVEEPLQEMQLTTGPSIDSISEGESQSFNITIMANGTGVEGVILNIIDDHGSLSGISDQGNGSYSFTYVAGSDAGGERESLNISASKDGYNSTFLVLSFNITEDEEPDRTLFLTIDPMIISITAGSSQLFEVTVKVNGTGIDDVDLDINTVHGNTTDPVGTGGGIYEFTYQAREDREGQTEVVNITAANDDHDDGSLEIEFIIQEQPKNDTLIVTITPVPDEVNLSAILEFTVNVTSDGDPVTGAELDIDPDEGEITNLVELGNGLYSFTYTAPEDEPDEVEEIRVRADKDGYDRVEKEVSFTLREPAISPTEPTLDGIIGQGEYDFSAEFGAGDLVIHWSIDGDVLNMGMVGDTAGWISIGFEPSQAMKDADMVIAWVSSQGVVIVIDAFSTGATGPHPADTDLGGSNDLIDVGGNESGGKTTIEFTRMLVTGDQYDKPIPTSGDLTIIWALGDSDSFNDQHSRTRRGSGSITMDTGGSSEEEDIELWPLHAFFMTLGMVSMITAMFVARFKKKETWWLKRHRMVGIAGSCSSLLGLLIGLYMVEDSTGEHFAVSHAYLGVLTLMMVGITPTVGLMIFKDKTKIKMMKTAHRWFGRITILLMILTILGGLSVAGVV